MKMSVYINQYAPKDRLLSSKKRPTESNKTIFLAILKGDEGQLYLNFNKGKESIVSNKSLIGYGYEFEQRVISGEWIFDEKLFFSCARLLACMDIALNLKKSGGNISVPKKTKTLKYHQLIGEKLPFSLEHFLINEALKEHSEISFLLDELRQCESYWLSQYLLIHLADKSNDVAALEKHYGVSTTHFRRLCNKYLGTCCKSQLRFWRATSAVLSTLTERKSLTNIAIDNGFCSPSHFSNEVKRLFGLSPREFRGLRKYFYDI
ncbi:helix-turn-helix domain-containing protein [Proteus mirabilis]|uniref:helix-turn-helix domain-containing protein n=1 Tax=Proteus mirabilis TaxID=584 RepID=UPI00234AB935|nr:helix-turn-helix domain-containing protein [Proteus mirabilis]MDC6013562.1 helix-turn-helix domain-containing protein [Proteus mirabilis]